MNFVYDVLEPVGLPVVGAYFTAKDNIFLNTSRDDATGFEALGNWVLTPSRYLFNGKRITHVDPKAKTCEFGNEFSAKDDKVVALLKTVLSIVLLLPSLLIGCVLKGLAYLYEETRTTHDIIVSNSLMTKDLPAKILENKKSYAELGINVTSDQTVAKNPHPIKKPTLSDPMLPPEVKKILDSQEIDKAALKLIVNVLMEAGLLWWIDFGTALGQYRHEDMIPWDKDIDLSILAPDHDLVKIILKAKLDPKKFDIWDFSPMSKPNSMLKIRIKETNMLIDVYHYTINDAPANKTETSETAPITGKQNPPKKHITYEFSHMHEWYIPEEALKREVSHSHEADVIFPLKKALFGGMEVYVPNKLEDYLLVKYANSEQSKKKSKADRLKELEPCRIWNEATKKYEKVPDHPYFKQSAFNY